MLKSLFVMTALVLASCGKPVVSESTTKSEYPYDYAINGSCQDQGYVRVCRALQIGGMLAVVDIFYNNGVLDTKDLSAFVRINYADGPRQAVFPKLYGFGNSQAQIRVTGGCLIGKLGGCVQYGTAEMRDLLHWAAQSNGTLNALDLEIAFVTADGKWDSQFGKNYTFHFKEQR